MRIALIARAAHAALVALALTSCRKEEIVTKAIGAAAPDAAKAPADHLAEGELIEGTANAFGLVLPRAIHVNQAFVNVVYASGDARPDAVANFIRARVRMGTVRIGAANTLFERVQIPGQP